jgi:hypothetical protein
MWKSYVQPSFYIQNSLAATNATVPRSTTDVLDATGYEYVSVSMSVYAHVNKILNSMSFMSNILIGHAGVLMQPRGSSMIGMCMCICLCLCPCMIVCAHMSHIIGYSPNPNQLGIHGGGSGGSDMMGMCLCLCLCACMIVYAHVNVIRNTMSFMCTHIIGQAHYLRLPHDGRSGGSGMMGMCVSHMRISI